VTGRAEPTDPIVRRATTADLPHLGRLGALLVEVHHAFDAQRFLPPRVGLPSDYAGYLGRQMDDPDVVMLVADDGGEVVGYAYGALDGYDYMALRGPAGLLHDIIVDPGYRRRGVGRRLLEAVIENMTARGAPRLVLSTAARNEAAQRLFASVGFRPTMLEMTRELATGR
jgi:ribosomal protein S18 acetylase RimI-like enzyme